MPFGEKSDDVRLLAATLVVVGGASYADVASKLEVSERTVSRWANHDEQFQEVLRELRAEVLSKVTSNLAGRLDLAVQTLERAMKSGVVHAEVRAAVAVVELYFRSTEHGETQERLARLEQTLAEEEETYR